MNYTIGEDQMSDKEKLDALIEAYRWVCEMFCMDPMKNEAYRNAIK